MSSTTIHWGRILLGGLLAEVALILAIVPPGLRLGDNFLHYTAPPGSFVMCFLGALLVCRRIESHFILHGTLVGDRKSTRLISSHGYISYAVFCLKKKKTYINQTQFHDQQHAATNSTAAMKVLPSGVTFQQSSSHPHAGTTSDPVYMCVALQSGGS